MHKAKTDTETNFVVTVDFTTKVDHQTTSKISHILQSSFAFSSNALSAIAKGLFSWVDLCAADTFGARCRAFTRKRNNELR